MRAVRNIAGAVIAVALIIAFVFFVRENGIGEGDRSGGSSVIQTAANTGSISRADTKKAPNTALSLRCESAIAVDADTGHILFAKNAHKRLYPASLTKLMTALLLSEHDGQIKKLTYSESAKAEPSNKMDFPVGSRLTADSAMKALLVFSANDVASMIAENISGDVDAFAALMNEKARSLGMKETHFANANGLTNSSHYTTAYDLSILARRVYREPWIISTMEMPSALVKTDSEKRVTVYNTNKTLDKNGCFAGKTGYTSAAGWCLAAFYHKDGRTILGVVMKSPSEDSLYADMEQLIRSL